MVAAELVSDDGVGEKEEHKLPTCIIFFFFGAVIIGYDIATSSELTLSLVPFLKSFNDFSLTGFRSSLYVAALLTYHLLGRRKIPVLLGWIIIIAGNLTSGFAEHLWMLIAGRILFGIGAGFTIKSAQAYADLHVIHRQPLKRMFAVSLSIAFGIYIAPAFSKFDGWRGSQLCACLPPVEAILFHLVFGLPNPRDIEADEELAVPLVMKKEGHYEPWGRPSNYYLVAALAVPLLMQKLTGINLVLMFYAPVLFHAMFVPSDALLLYSVTINVAVVLGTNFIFKDFYSLPS
ncbi:Sugar transport protein 1 [Linum grandiflorum]